MSIKKIEQLEFQYNSEVRFHDLVNYMTGIIRSGAFTGEDVRDAALLAVNKAEAERAVWPTQTTQER
jgi:hypothetical protein